MALSKKMGYAIVLLALVFVVKKEYNSSVKVFFEVREIINEERGNK